MDHMAILCNMKWHLQFHEFYMSSELAHDFITKLSGGGSSEAESGGGGGGKL